MPLTFLWILLPRSKALFYTWYEWDTSEHVFPLLTDLPGRCPEGNPGILSLFPVLNHFNRMDVYNLYRFHPSLLIMRDYPVDYVAFSHVSAECNLGSCLKATTLLHRVVALCGSIFNGHSAVSSPGVS
jgi:hypothetical protein